MTTTVDRAPSAGTGTDGPTGRPGPGLRERLVPSWPADGWWGWLGPLAVTAVAALLRFPGLSHPHAFSFDETYYAKDALSLWRFGYEQETVEKANDLLLAGKTDVFTGQPEFVVHPPVGKWVIGIGEWLFGMTPFGWRFSVAVIGTLTVLLVARIGRRLFRSTLLGSLAGLLLALDGLSIVMSRTGLLDTVLTGFVVAAFGCLLVDRDRTRARLADWAEARSGLPLRRRERGPALGLRPWRLSAGVLLGLACATKWSGLWFVAGFGLLTVLWDAGARRAVGVRRPFASMLRRDALPAFSSIVPVALLVYLVSWTGWFLTGGGWDRDWAAGRTTSFPFVPAALRSLWHYHAQMYSFNIHLETPHNYAGKPIGWLLMVRPTAFWTENLQPGQGTCPGPSSCVSEVIAIGTPLLWWAGTAALLWLVWRWIGGRDWRAGALLMGVAAGWLPWVVLFSHRTVFTMYAVVIAPFLVLGLTMALGAVLGPAEPGPRRTWGAAGVGAFVLLVLVNTAWIHPVLVGAQLPYDEWLRHLMFRGWI